MSQKIGGKRNRGHHYDKSKINVDGKDKDLENIDESNSVVKQFRVYSAELDEKYDRFERIVKLSRDITIESKRIIFLLHTLDKESKRDAILSKAKLRLDNIGSLLFIDIATELYNQDIYQYLKAYRAGLEEYIEAVTFYQYLQCRNMQDWVELENSLRFTIIGPERKDKMVEIIVTPNEYISGIADLTGELMRKCINDLATGDITSCYHTCNFVRHMYKCFLGCTYVSGRKHKKVYTLRQSLNKIESVCYTIKVRGSEIPKHMLADVAVGATEKFTIEEEEEEGY